MLLCQFFVLVGNRLWFYILLMYLGVQSNCGVVFSFFGSNPPENNVEPVPAKSEPVQLCGCVGFFVVVPTKSELPPKQSAGK